MENVHIARMRVFLFLTNLLKPLDSACRRERYYRDIFVNLIAKEKFEILLNLNYFPNPVVQYCQDLNVL